MSPYRTELTEFNPWREKHRTDNELQKILPLIEDALPSVLEIHKTIPIVAYIIIRPKTVVDGTKHWLDRHGFPDAEIIARPEVKIFEGGPVPRSLSEGGNKWKAETLQELYPIVQGIVDDSDEVVSHLPPDYPGTVYLYDHDTSPRTDIRVIPCPTWKDVGDHCLQSI